MSALHDIWLREKHRLRPFLGVRRWWRRGRIILPLHHLPISSKYFGRPKGGYADGATYTQSPAGRTAGATYHEIYPAETHHRRPPTVVGGPIPELFLANLEASFAAAGVTVIPGGRHWGFYGGTIITPDDRVLIDVSRDVWQWAGHTVRTRFKLPACRPLPGITVSLTTPEAEANYWHWTTELLPKMHLLEKAGFPPGRVDHYLVNMSGARYQRETLAALGVAEQKIIVPSSASHFECETLVVPTTNQCDHDVPQWVVAWLRSLSVPANPRGQRRLFLSRADAGFRRLLNEQEILEALAPHSFEIVRASALDVAGQRRLFNEAAIVVGPHGAAFTNSVWCRPGTPCIEFMPGDYCYLAFWALGEAAVLPHTVVLGESIPDRTRQRFADFSVSAAQVRAAVDAILAATPTSP